MKFTISFILTSLAIQGLAASTASLHKLEQVDVSLNFFLFSGLFFVSLVDGWPHSHDCVFLHRTCLMLRATV